MVEGRQIKVIKEGHLPAAPLVSMGRLLTGADDGQWIEVEGLVHSAVAKGGNVTLNVAMTDGTISATTVEEEGRDYSRLIDATVRMRGSVAPFYTRNRQMTGVRLFFPSLAQVTILEPAPADTTSYPSCGSWPCTVNVNTGSPQSINSLADVAQYYYITDLRTPANEPRGHLFYDDNVQAVGSGPEDDKARWQHMTTFSIALGVSGTIKYVSDYKTSAVSGATDVPIDTRFADIRVGTDTAGNVANWPLWPDPSLDYSNANNYNDPRAIDDFWHAAVNGRGLYFSAGNPTSVIAGLAGSLAGITARVASSTGAGTSNLEPVPGDNFVYLASYTTQKWTGDVQSHEIDVNTGLIQAPVIWSAQSLLDAAVSNACDNRKIMLFRSGAANNLVNFSWNTQACDGSGNPTGVADTGLNAAEQANFGAANVSLLSQYPSMTGGTLGTVDQRTPAAGANLVNFLRGQRGLENFTTDVANELYRKRDHVLGDVVDG